MENRDKFLWRPNDNSAKTLLRYDLEAEHWARAFKSAVNQTKPTIAGPMIIISAILSIIFAILYGIISYSTDLFFYLRRKRIEKKIKTNDEKFASMSGDEWGAMFNEAMKLPPTILKP